MLGITIRLGASKDELVSTATGHVFADRYEARNRVRNGKPAPDTSYLKACHAIVMDAARRAYGRAA